MKTIEGTQKVAEFKIHRNDMFWSLTDLAWDGDNYEFFRCRWTGYNDSNWWDNVATKEENQTITVTGDKGTVRKYRIDFHTNIVTEVTNE